MLSHVLLKRILLVIICACIIGILISNKFLYPLFEKILVDYAESQSISLGTHLSNMIVPEHSVINSVQIKKQRNQILRHVEEFSLYKLKIFSPAVRQYFLLI